MSLLNRLSQLVLGKQVAPGEEQKSLGVLNTSANHWYSLIREPYSGAWQRNDELKLSDALGYPTLYACVTLISQDIAKLPFMLMEQQGEVWVKQSRASYDPVLRKPNYYQTAAQFRESWILSKLLLNPTLATKRSEMERHPGSGYFLVPFGPYAGPAFGGRER